MVSKLVHASVHSLGAPAVGVEAGTPLLGLSAASRIRWVKLVVRHGTPAAKPQGGDRRAAWIDAHATFILDAVKAKDDITLAELQVLLAERGTPFGIETLWRFSDRHRITRKQKTAHATEQDRPDVLKRWEE